MPRDRCETFALQQRRRDALEIRLGAERSAELISPQSSVAVLVLLVEGSTPVRLYGSDGSAPAGVEEQSNEARPPTPRIESPLLLLPLARLLLHFAISLSSVPVLTAIVVLDTGLDHRRVPQQASGGSTSSSRATTQELVLPANATLADVYNELWNSGKLRGVALTDGGACSSSRRLTELCRSHYPRLGQHRGSNDCLLSRRRVQLRRDSPGGLKIGR